MAYDEIPADATIKPSKYIAHVSDQELDDFKQLLRLSKIGPETFENKQEDRRFGLTHAWISKAKQYWEQQFDWRKTEDEINGYPNFIAPFDDRAGGELRVHFVALFSKRRDAIPITLLHGWPGSFLEFLPTLDLLKKKYSPEDLPYHVVVPSLPGYGYSSGPPVSRDWTQQDMARIVDELMVGLGFGSGYVTQGGDIGSYVSRILAVNHEACKAVHLNFSIGTKPDKSASESSLPEHEQKALERSKEFIKTGSAYAFEHATRPATIGLVLSSSPIALLAWIAEKFLAWTDKDPSLDTILSSVTLYWFTSTYPRSLYPYRESTHPNKPSVHGQEDYYIKKPLGYSWFPYDMGAVPRAWMEKSGDLVFWRTHETGGHFAAMEEPEAFLRDVGDFATQVWKTTDTKL